MDNLMENCDKVWKIILLVLLCGEMGRDLPGPTGREPTLREQLDELHATAAADYLASIRLKYEDYPYGEGHLCSGALIAPAAVLTTAQCVYNYQASSKRHPSELRVVLGSRERFSKSPDSLDLGITHIHVPSTFSPFHSQGNVAILMLEQNVPRDVENIKPISLNVAVTEAKRPSYNYELTGWARMANGVRIPTLLTLNTSISSSNSIQLLDADVPHIAMDSGSCLTHSRSLVALAFSPSQDQGNAQIFVELSSLRQWIRETIGEGHQQDSSIWGVLGFAVFTIFAFKSNEWKFPL